MIRTPLMEHQKLIVDHCAPRKFAGIFAEYGTGKTLTILALAEQLNVTKVLVVCSKTAIEATWPVELSLHTDFPYVYLLGTKDQRISSLSYGLAKARIPESAYAAQYFRPVFFLINYDGIKSIYNELAASSFDMLVVDESTKIKYPTTKRTKILWALGKTVPRRYILTGFPITESPIDLYSQIKFLDNGVTLGNSYYGFLDKYFSKMGYRYVPKKGATKEILDKIAPFCIRITNELLKLPPKRYFKKEIEKTPEQQLYLKQLKDTMELEIGDVQISTEYIFTILAKTTEICDGFVKDSWYQKLDTIIDEQTNQRTKVYKCKKCETIYHIIDRLPKPKCDHCEYTGAYEVIPTNKDQILLDLLEEIDIEHHKVIIWSPFRFTLFKLAKILANNGINSVSLTGDTEDVKAVVDKFMNSKTHNVLLATEKKAAESLNLTNCNIAIYYSNEWSYDKRANSEARIYRKGSEKHQHIIYIDFVTKHSVEEIVYNCLRTKKNLVDELKTQFIPAKGIKNDNSAATG